MHRKTDAPRLLSSQRLATGDGQKKRKNKRERSSKKFHGMMSSVPIVFAGASKDLVFVNP